MEETITRLSELKKELTRITKEVENGKIEKKEAAEMIIEVREEIDRIIEHVKTVKRSTSV